ncbi:50S ribosomal protein L9 [Kordiimonas sp. SCSIO 12610]|uniref:50S ribosomal protein L9 n=1 Tax=Kordiimonas sp. SCSIO 12610 TaxID=2829597 RepID=UPI00210D97C8|nr:50S ribosomal protein L9 [Kordiimonas sp. SCSIO 12610]UTW53863.1 50S ribosomal protein L9 [Kordiimonas sp. SCSIO 12610]
MQVILLERVAKLGQMGDEVTVKDGFARNFLLPQKKAMRATEANKQFFENERARLEADNLARREEAEKVAGQMAGLKCVMVRSAGESGQLYGSVTSRDIAEAVTEAGVKIGRSQVVLDRAIKTLGLHDVVITLHPEVSETVVVNIARSEAEAETQFEIGGAIVGGDEEEAEEEFVEDVAEEVEASEETTEETEEEKTDAE